MNEIKKLAFQDLNKYCMAMGFIRFGNGKY